MLGSDGPREETCSEAQVSHVKSVRTVGRKQSQTLGIGTVRRRSASTLPVSLTDYEPKPSQRLSPECSIAQTLPPLAGMLWLG